MSIDFTFFSLQTNLLTGATAILPVVDPSIRALGWYYLPIILLTSTLALVVALLFNNVQRRYPIVWITLPELPTIPKLSGITRVFTTTDTKGSWSKNNSSSAENVAGLARIEDGIVTNGSEGTEVLEGSVGSCARCGIYLPLFTRFIKSSVIRSI